ncbi:YhcN/YlaJ family sporulation lipoprotein [Virgibacillus senegalensis]|uniref:YhcN/YlaJ family sporulation lipoprotein n=1 Tax=Virgibacillus senegalensis TaxID=1499679 RepID=UPI00069D88B3|nr:YhcN/YlaJ family sporulation lipoprotein [Virgibacillus senegalensis]
MKWKALGVTLLGTAMLMGCNNNDGNQTGQGTNDNGVQQTRFNNTTDYPNRGNAPDDDGWLDNRNMANDDNQDNQGNQNDNNNRYDVDEQLANRIAEQVDDIDRAYVLTTGNNVYVAAELNKGTKGNNGNGGNNNDTGGNNNGNDGNNANFGANGNNNNNGNNNGGDNNQVSDKIKEEVAKVVREADDNVDNVYVSTNPDFVNLSNDYVQDVRNGEPVEGFFEEFGEMTRRIFPQNR